MTGTNIDQVGAIEKQLTIREKIIRCLESEPMTARDLSKALRISEKDHLQRYLVGCFLQDHP